MTDEDATLVRMGWTVSRTVTTEGPQTIRVHQVQKGRRRLTYTITTTAGSTTASLGAPVCEIEQPDGTWRPVTWREWSAGMEDSDAPFPFPA